VKSAAIDALETPPHAALEIVFYDLAIVRRWVVASAKL
jgi:hypothetical protein